jgi:phosphoribosyl-dephospho-CoA transferase
MVERVVVELLQSDKNGVCARQEKEKCEVKEHALFCRIVRELAQNKKTNRWRPNVLCIVAQVVYGCRRQREEVGKNVSVGEVVKKCTESITGLIVQHGWVRVWRQIQNYARGREFIASMLYLMRMGITFQKRQILPKMTVLNALLPIQALLPSVFKIRAKSITEGENIIKLDIRKIPL